MLALDPPAEVLRALRNDADNGRVTWSTERGLRPPKKGVPTLVFRADAAGTFLVAVGRYQRHGTAATDLDVQVRLDMALILERPVPVQSITLGLPARLRPYLQLALESERAIPAKTASAVLDSLRTLSPSAVERLERIASLSEPFDLKPGPAIRWGQEKDAIALALRAAGMSPSVLREWSPPEADDAPFLAGIAATSEATMMEYDAGRLPGMIPKRQVRSEIHVFSDGDHTVEVANVNATGVETALGTDLLYFHRESQAFVLVQYKKSNAEGRLRIDARVRDQVKRMQAFEATSIEAASPEQFRLSKRSAAWLKVVKPSPIDHSATELLNGMYIPARLFWLLLEDERTVRGRGRSLSVDTVRQYFTNSLFVPLLREGWIGTVGVSTSAVKSYVRDALAGERSIVIAEEAGDLDHFERRRRLNRSSTTPEMDSPELPADDILSLLR